MYNSTYLHNIYIIFYLYSHRQGLFYRTDITYYIRHITYKGASNIYGIKKHVYKAIFHYCDGREIQYFFVNHTRLA